MFFEDLVKWYFDNYAKNQLKEITQYNYRQMLNCRVLPVLGRKRLKAFDNVMLTEYFANLDATPSTCRSVYIILRSIFTCALKMGFIDYHPCDNVILPKKEVQLEEKRPPLTRDQAVQLMEMTSEYSSFNFMIQFLLLTGMRSGEAFGLMWKDIDFEKNTIFIRRNLANVASKHWLDTPKTKSSIRRIGMSEQLKELLLCHKEHQEEFQRQKEEKNEPFPHPEMVLTSAHGDYVSHNYVEKKFKKFVKDTDFSYITLHSLRHANATLMLANGVDLKVVSSLLGHTNISTTADIYADVLNESKAKAAQEIALQLLA